MTLRRALMLTLLCILIAIPGTEGLLQMFDPLGVYTRQVDWHIFYNHLEAHETGYRLPTGTLHMTGYSATINVDGTRYTPDTAIGADCTIAAVGDSMTFGMGANDADVWVNQLAGRYADVKFINTGRPRYNIMDVLALIQHYPADGYVYLHTLNDDQPNDWQAWLSRGYVEPFKPALYYYWHHLRDTRPVTRDRFVTDEDMHRRALADIAAIDSVLIIAFDNDWLLDRLPDDTVIIPWHNNPISPADAHPNRAGHERMADEIHPHIDDFLAGVCQ
ncbi:MAG: SGNH/GDSL hydrolase family protein [Aggregatilineales bacterium]